MSQRVIKSIWIQRTCFAGGTFVLSPANHLLLYATKGVSIYYEVCRGWWRMGVGVATIFGLNY